MMRSLEDPIWYPPLNVAYHFQVLKDRLTDEERQGKDFRKAEEMFAVALMLAGIQKIQDRKYWMQLVGDAEGSPDVRTGAFVPPTTTAAEDFSVQDVEVVTYDEHSSDPLVDFLKRTKLSKTSGYDELTTILCHIRRGTRLPPMHELRDELAVAGSKCPVMILGKVSSTEEIYKVVQVNPAIDLISEFDLIKELQQQQTGVLRLMRGSKPVMHSFPDEKHYPFEKLGFKPV